MAAFKRIMVGLDLTQMDYALISFVCNFLRINPAIEHIYFIHVAKDLETAGEEGTDIPSDELIRQKMKSEVAKCYRAGHDVKMDYEILEGDPLKQLLHWSRVKRIDLIIAGKKVRERGKGILMEKMARKSSCSILFVTEQFGIGFNRILVPVDFSTRTDHVLEKMDEIAGYMPESAFICLHVVEVPHGYTRIGKTYEEFAEIMIQNARHEWQNYRRSHPPLKAKFEEAFILNHEYGIARAIYQYAHDNHIDMIVLGSRAQTDAAVFLLGSVAEKLITCDHEIPLLLIKQPGKVVDAFKAIDYI